MPLLVKGERVQVCKNFECTGKFLGKGNFGKVYEGNEIGTNKKVAIKQILLPKEEQSLQRELDILQKLSQIPHPNVLTLYEIIKLSSDKGPVIQIVTELCDCDLQKHWNDNGYPGEEECKLIFYQLKCGLQKLFASNIVHRDLKPDNILVNLDNNKKVIAIKIADFGLARITPEEQLMRTIAGSPVYMAPEIFLLNDPNYTNKVDLWSIGVILYRALNAGKFPFPATTSLQLLKLYQAKEQLHPFNDSSKLSEDVKDLIFRLLVINPEDRIGWEDFFSHPWLSPFSLDIKYIEELHQLAISKCANQCFEEGLGIFLKCLISLQNTICSKLTVEEEEEKRVEPLYNEGLKHVQVLRSAGFEPSPFVEQAIFQHGLEQGKIAGLKEAVGQVKESIEYYDRTITILRSIRLEARNVAARKELNYLLDVFIDRRKAAAIQI